MNERMLELYKQAQVSHAAIDPSNNMPYETTRFSAEKFAELIVKECADILIKEVEVALDASGNPVSPEDFIKEHFGVKE